MKKLRLLGLPVAMILAISLLVVSCDPEPEKDPSGPPVSYVITGSGTSFTATKDGVAVAGASGTIQAVIDALRADANRGETTIQFGDGTDPLDIGGATAVFTGAWGNIIFTGKLTGASESSSSPHFRATLFVEDNITASSSADITSTVGSGKGIRWVSTGTLTITGGTISAMASNATGVVINAPGSGSTLNITGGIIEGRYGGVENGLSNTVNMSGGTVRTDTGVAIWNHNRSNTLNISGGTVTTTSASGNAIYSWEGHVNLSGNATVTSSANNTSSEAHRGTINLSSDSNTTYTGTVLTVGPNVILTNTGGGPEVWNPRNLTVVGWPR